MTVKLRRDTAFGTAPSDLRQPVPILCIQGAVLKPFQQRLAIFGAEGGLLEPCKHALQP